MDVIPCEQNKNLRKQVIEFAETFKTSAHLLGDHGLTETDFYQGGLFRGAIERIRGQFSAAMRQKREFVRFVFDYMHDQKCLKEWTSSGGANRHDYTVILNDGKIAGIELKGCLDGNNTNIFERPPHVHEFIIWSVCANSAADPKRNVASGIHTRLSAEIIEHGKQVDGLVVWDWLCGTVGRPCPKLLRTEGRQVTVGPYKLTPPCIYLFPDTIPTPRNNPNPPSHSLQGVGFLNALHKCFGGYDDELNYVRFNVAYQGSDTVRSTTVIRGGVTQFATPLSPIRRK